MGFSTLSLSLCLYVYFVLLTKSVFLTYIRFKFYLLARICLVGCSAFDMIRSLFVICVNDGLAAGSGDQHSSINFLHSGSQRSGMLGLRVLFTIPPKKRVKKTNLKLNYDILHFEG